jgi:multidrug efflux pump
VNLTAGTDLQSVEGFKRLVVRSTPDALVRLEDVADVVMGADDYESDVRMSGKKEVFMAFGCSRTPIRST